MCTYPSRLASCGQTLFTTFRARLPVAMEVPRQVAGGSQIDKHHTQTRAGIIPSGCFEAHPLDDCLGKLRKAHTESKEVHYRTLRSAQDGNKIVHHMAIK